MYESKIQQLFPSPRTPRHDTEGVQKILAILKTDSKPVTLKCEPVTDGIPQDCFENVNKAILINKGGDIVYGWKIWETFPGVMIEAEFHAVWNDTFGKLHEVSPHLPNPDGTTVKEVLFVEDSSIKDDGLQIDNLRIALRKDPLIKKFIKNAKKKYKLLNSGELSGKYGYITIEPGSELEYVAAEGSRLQNEICKKYYQ